MVKGKTCTGCGCFHPEEGKQKDPPKGPPKPPKPPKGGGEKDPPCGPPKEPKGPPKPGDKPGKEKDPLGETPHGPTREREDKQNKIGDIAAKVKELEEKLGKLYKEYDKARSSGARNEARALDIKIRDVNQELSKLHAELQELLNELKQQYQKEGITPPTRSGGDGSNKYRIGVEGFDPADLAPDKVEPMTRKEFASRIREEKHRAIESRQGDLDERKMIDAVTGNEEHPWESITMEPLSPVHIVIAVDNSGSMKQSLGLNDKTSKAYALAQAMTIIMEVCEEVNADSDNKEGSFSTTIVKWSDCNPGVIKGREETKTSAEVSADYMSYYTSDTIIGPLVELINADIPVIAGENTLVLLITDGEIFDQHMLQEEMDSNQTRAWTLLGMGAHNPLFEQTVYQCHEIQQVMFDAILATVAKVWNR
jgi:hypothetical protein